MPQRKKTGQSPGRAPGLSDEGSNNYTNTGYRLSQGYDGAMANNFPSSPSLPNSDKDKIVKNMQEMFSHLDHEVIYIVLSECDFKAENAMDSLLELSVAAEVAAPVPSRISGFELTAAALLSPHLSERSPDPNPSKPSQLPFSPPATSPLTEEFDLLIDQELETLTTQPKLKEELPSGQYFSADAPLSSFPPPPIPQQVLPELLQSSLEPGARGPSVEQQCPEGALVEQASGSPLDQLSFWEEENIKGQQSVLDFTHLTSESPAANLKPPLDFGASGRPSAFQVYKKQDQPQILSERATVIPSGSIVGGARSKVSTVSQEPLSNVSSSWNPEAPVFCPRNHGDQGPAFITPVALTPSKWATQPRHASHWLTQGPVTQAPLKPSATIPKSWALPTAPRGPAPHSRLRLEGNVLVLLRGAPGSGKSTLARAILEHNPGGVILSTDDYFCRHGEYHFDPSALGEAHEWNHKRAKEAFQSGANPIIIDNTNMQSWEMRPYVTQALKHRYKVLFREPDTWWKNKPRELERRTRHDVPVERIRRMLDGYERFVSVQSIMGSQPPERKQPSHQEISPSQPMSSDTPRPDLVGEPGLAKGCEKSRPQLFSSLPDVSSIGRSGEMGMLERSSHNSTESLNLLPSENVQEKPEIPNEDDEMDLGTLDSELDAHLELGHPSGDQGIPDCIVESVLNEDNRGDEMPVAFSESIGQRVRRERRSRRPDFDNLEPADLVKDTKQSGREVEENEAMEAEGEIGSEMVRDGGEKGRPELLDFVGDWPSEGGLEQRQVRRRERHGERNGEEEGGVTEEDDYHDNTMKVRPGPDVTEFQKLLDLIQTGVDSTGSFPDSALSPSSGEESEREGEARGQFQGSHGDRYNREDSEQDVSKSDSIRAELPDCVLDWKAADSFKGKETPQSIVVECGGSIIKNGESSTRRGSDHMLEVGREIGSVCSELKNSLCALSADSQVFSQIVEAKDNRDRAGIHNIEGEVISEVDAGHTEKDTNYCTDGVSLTGVSAEDDGSHIDEVSQSPICEGTVEAESSPFSGGSQERKQRQGRRSGKHCRLALTFTQNCPSSSPKTLKDSPNTTAQNLNSSQDSNKPDVEPDCNPSLDPSPNFDLYPDHIPQSSPESQQQFQSPIPVVDTGCPTQTDPQDFALLWRFNHHVNPDDTVVAGNRPGDIVVLSGDPYRFMPELSCAVSAAIAVHPSGHREVPYRVVHEKGTQVEEKELGAARSQLESLRILSRHFKLVSFDTLEDLYDKCHQDLEWTTNLLLDSGERFFRDEDSEEGEDSALGEDCRLYGALGMAVNTGLSSSALDELHPEDCPKLGPAGDVEVTQESANKTVNESDESSDNTESTGGITEDKGVSRTLGITEGGTGSFGGVLSQVVSSNEDHPDQRLHFVKSPQPLLSLLRAVREEEACEDTKQEVRSATVGREFEFEGGAYGGSVDDSVIFEEVIDENGDDEISSMDEITRVLLAELEELERREGDLKEERTERRDWEERSSQHLDIQSVELKLPTELALQLTELFGPVGVDPGACSTDDYAVLMDLNLAKLLHQKWKDTIQERQRQAALSYHLLQESSVHWGESQVAKTGPRMGTHPAHFLIGADGYASLGSQPEAQDEMPFMDHWSVSHPKVSLRDIMTEEQARQENVEKTRQSRADLDKRDGATLLKENQLYSLFPTIDTHFLQDIFRDHNYSLKQTAQFLHSLLDDGPVKTVVAPEPPVSDHHRTPSKEREKRQKPLESVMSHYQDIEDPEYEDFRAEASLQKRRQLESFAKAAEAFKQGHKSVASFYAQQGHHHGQLMREANHRAAVQIFERVNSSLLPKNILDLHGLHVDEALHHLAQVLLDKTTEYEQGRCRPQLSVITGKGNHSQGGMARIRPAVIDYLKNKNYRFTEPKPGLVLVSLN